MDRRFFVRPLAEADLEDASRWYEDERPGLADRFLTDVDRTFARIVEGYVTRSVTTRAEARTRAQICERKVAPQAGLEPVTLC
jgi:hypothetical protein